MKTTYTYGPGRLGGSLKQRTLLQAATRNLIDYAKTCTATGTGADFLLAWLQRVGSDGKVSIPGPDFSKERVVDATELVAGWLSPILDAEGDTILGEVGEPGWAAAFLRKLHLLEVTKGHYLNFASMEEEAEPLDRSSDSWKSLVRRNITIPEGLIFEIAAVRERLAESDPPIKISVSGFIELAIKELLERPVDRDDARFYDEDLQEFYFQPEVDDRTVAQIVEASEIRGRRATRTVIKGQE